MSKLTGDFSWKEGVTLKEYFTTILIELREDYSGKISQLDIRMAERFNGQDKAIGIANSAMDKRLESMNEFRSQLKDQTGTFLTREAYDARHQILQNQVDDLRLSKAELSGKASQSAVNVSMWIAILGILLSVAGLVHSFTLQ